MAYQTNYLRCGLVLATALLVFFLAIWPHQSGQAQGLMHQDRLDRWNPNWMQRDMWGPGQMGPGMQQRMVRHWTFMHQGIPAVYRAERNPLSPNALVRAPRSIRRAAHPVTARQAWGMEK